MKISNRIFVQTLPEKAYNNRKNPYYKIRIGLKKNYIKYNNNLKFLWVTFIIIISLSIKNHLHFHEQTIYTSDFIFINFFLLYCLYLYKQFFLTKKIKFVTPKIFLIWLVIFIIIWPLIEYTI